MAKTKQKILEDVESVEFTETKSNPDLLDTFEFEDSPTSLDSPLQKPLAGETESEGGSFSQILNNTPGGEYSNPEFIEGEKNKSNLSVNGPADNKGSIIPESNTPGETGGQPNKKPAGHGYDKFAGGFGNIPPKPPPGFIPGAAEGMPGGGGLSDDYKDIPFIEGDEEEIETGGSGGSGGSIKIPDDLAKSNAKRIAKFIVDTEESFVLNFLRNKVKLNVLEIKRNLVVNRIDAKFSANLLLVAESHNKDVDNLLTLSSEDKRMLREAWENVLVQYDEISDKLTPEIQLVVAHLQIGFKLYSQTSDLRQNAMSTMTTIKESLEEMGAMIRDSMKNKGKEKENDAAGTESEPEQKD
jgi:hypothetical protein